MTEKQTCPKCRLIRGAALFLGFKTNLKKPLDTNTVLEHNKEYLNTTEPNIMQVYEMNNTESLLTSGQWDEINYRPDELIKLKQHLTLEIWEEIKQHPAYHHEYTKAVLNLELDPYQAILTSEGFYWHFCTSGKYWIVYKVGTQGDTFEMVRDEISRLRND